MAMDKKYKRIMNTVIALIVIGYAMLLASMWVPALQSRSVKNTISVACMMFSGVGIILYIFLLIKIRHNK